MEDLTDRIACLVVRGLMFFFEHLPLRVGLRAGEIAGHLAFFCSAKRRVAYINLKAALGAKLSAKQRWKAVYEHFGHMGQMAVEILSSRKFTRAYSEEHHTVHHLERLESFVREGRGGVFLTAHLGNWELLGLFAGLRGIPIYVLGSVQKFPRLNALLNQLREAHGAVAINRGAALRALFRALREKKMIGALGDQSAGKDGGVLLPFFGRRTTVPDGIYELAQRAGVVLFPCFMVRTGGMDHAIYFEEFLKDDPSLEGRERVIFQARQYLKLLEQFIERFPGQWLWENKRWKFSWDRRVVILSDGKAGHFKQSEVVAAMLSEFKEFHGREGLQFETVRIHVEYRSPFHRAALFALAFLMRPWIQGRLHWMAPFLTPETQQALEQVNADFIIAAGSGLAPVQMLLVCETGAKKIVIMNPPSPYAWTRYDLAIVPAHDGGRVPRGAFRSVIMPSGYRTQDRAVEVQELRAKLGENVRPKIAVFLGGATRDYDLTVSDMEKLCSILKRVGTAAGGFMLTTSRRTTAPVERFLKSMLAGQPLCHLLVIANEENPPYAAAGMMGLADLLIVTEDSLAMISEAVGTGKRVIVLSLGEGELPEKHYRFHQILNHRGLVTVSGLADLEKNITELFKKPAFPALQREKDALSERLGGLI